MSFAVHIVPAMLAPLTLSSPCPLISVKAWTVPPRVKCRIDVALLVTPTGNRPTRGQRSSYDPQVPSKQSEDQVAKLSRGSDLQWELSKDVSISISI